MITHRELASALAKRGLAEWVVIERDQDVACIDEEARVRRVEHRVRWQITAHFDSPAGRGSAHVTIDGVDLIAMSRKKQGVASGAGRDIERSSFGEPMKLMDEERGRSRIGMPELLHQPRALDGDSDGTCDKGHRRMELAYPEPDAFDEKFVEKHGKKPLRHGLDQARILTRSHFHHALGHLGIVDGVG